MTLDFRTVLIHSTAILLVLSFSPFFYSRSELREKAYLRLWVMALPLSFLGNMVVAMKGVLPEPIPMIFGNLLFKAGSAALLAGILSFKGSRLPGWLATGIPLSVVIPLMCFPSLARQMAVRTAFLSAHSFAFYLVAALILLRRRDPRLGRMEFHAIFFLFVMVSINALRLVLIQFLGYPEGMQAWPSWDALVTIIYSVAFMGLAIALFTLHSARLAAELREALASKQLLMKEMNHRLKNDLALVDSLLGLAPDFSAQGEDGAEWVEGTRDRIRCIAAAYDLLHAGEDMKAISIDGYLQRITDGLVAPAKVAIETEFQDIEAPSSLAVPLGLVANELATNSIKYAFAGRARGRISMSLVRESGQGILVLSDDGIGTSWPPKREGFGTMIVTALVAQIGGKLEYRNEGGSTWTVSFPLAPGGKDGKRLAGS